MYKLIRPLLFLQDPEIIHDYVLWLGKHCSWLKKPFSCMYDFKDTRLEQTIAGISFANPVGLAAGFDKNGVLLDILPSFGFGFIEIGSVTALHCAGNPKPRLFRLPKDKCIINRMGLNNIGAKAMEQRLCKKQVPIPLGINIAKTNDPAITGDKARGDICFSYEWLYDAADYITLNISCPNTQEEKTDEDPDSLEKLLATIREARLKFEQPKPLFLKLSLDLSYAQLDAILELGLVYGIDGYVIGNTSLQRNGLQTPLERLTAIGTGGMSGKPIKKRATELIRYVYQHAHPIIIGVGGVFSAEDAYEKITAGASLVQVYTGLIYEGPGLVKAINKGLVALLDHDGFPCVKNAVGTT